MSETSAARPETELRSTGIRAVTVDYDTDPLSGVPDEVRGAVGCYDADSAGGCG
ncbi:hypothetical protein [Nocardia brasiliensis]|uniref:hypothetical protein n=1 Tax=Nocardia brasiliensis TaxID=37326 RepID=UPI0033EFEA4A